LIEILLTFLDAGLDVLSNLTEKMNNQTTFQNLSTVIIYQNGVTGVAQMQTAIDTF